MLGFVARLTVNSMAIHPLREAREKAGITQTKLGLKVGVSPNKISDIENWRVKPCKSWADKLSAYFNIPDYDLFPSQEYLIGVVKDLTEENNRLRAIVAHQNHTPEQIAKTRDNSRFL